MVEGIRGTRNATHTLRMTDGKDGVALDETGANPRIEKIALRGRRSEARGDGGRLEGVIRRDGSDPPGDDKMSGLLMMTLMKNDVEAQREVGTGGATHPEEIRTGREDAQETGDAGEREDDRLRNSVDVMVQLTRTLTIERLVTRSLKRGNTGDGRSSVRNRPRGELTRHLRSTRLDGWGFQKVV
jgi:hypothetical protein